jgi:hypothetical protein
MIAADIKEAVPSSAMIFECDLVGNECPGLIAAITFQQ